MTVLPNRAPRLRIVMKETAGHPMEDLIANLQSYAASIEETASRCTDPVIVSELQHISGQMRADAQKAIAETVAVA